MLYIYNFKKKEKNVSILMVNARKLHVMNQTNQNAKIIFIMILIVLIMAKIIMMNIIILNVKNIQKMIEMFVKTLSYITQQKNVLMTQAEIVLLLQK